MVTVVDSEAGVGAAGVVMVVVVGSDECFLDCLAAFFPRFDFEVGADDLV